MKSEVYCYASVQLQAAKRKIMSVIVEGTITTVTQALSQSNSQSVSQSVSQSRLHAKMANGSDSEMRQINATWQPKAIELKRNESSCKTLEA